MTRRGLALLAALVALVLGAGIFASGATAATSVAVQANPGNIICSKDNTRELTGFWRTCPKGQHYYQTPASDVAGLDERIRTVVGQLVTLPPTTTRVDSPMRLVEKTVTVDDDTTLVKLDLPGKAWVINFGFDPAAGARQPVITPPAADPKAGLADLLIPARAVDAITFSSAKGTLNAGESKSVTFWALVVVR